ncbi:hypothetical protein GCM10020367_24330 [Streptomyces sannanensis]|uniref:Uncharacterized protein n=1 Tax=Streptomyces sannanensis TaxID=285536 RepID=A0ABP6SA24_9ACTN
MPRRRTSPPGTAGPLPATGAVAALITKATGKAPYCAGKPNPLMMRTGLDAIGAHSGSSAMIGDRMDPMCRPAWRRAWRPSSS